MMTSAGRRATAAVEVPYCKNINFRFFSFLRARRATVTIHLDLIFDEFFFFFFSFCLFLREMYLNLEIQNGFLCLCIFFIERRRRIDFVC